MTVAAVKRKILFNVSIIWVAMEVTFTTACLSVTSPVFVLIYLLCNRSQAF